MILEIHVSTEVEDMAEVEALIVDTYEMLAAALRDSGDKDKTWTITSNIWDE